MSYTYSNFKEDLRRRAFEEKNRFYKRVLEVVEDYINQKLLRGFIRKMYLITMSIRNLFFY
ncbi:hypothetical protein [Mesobacillus boroniphilus]|uniref:Uncharacterized protein n=1 Tax=Mesobacillus boroniphilus JCM 21738 TaxID=1294265 RepID=W4RWQ8_9BACI|nr:hypothetical protein [Mesobacillus boroniphilus]GAE48313.1 hypothetical protein JCM21738_5421 [Mesobacillus boroniphilus JCM 21738]